MEQTNKNWSLRLVDACRSTRQGRPLLTNVSLELQSGSRVGVRGASGSGKSTLLRMIAKLIPLNSGQLLWNGKSVKGTSVPQYRAKVLYAGSNASTSSETVLEALRSPFNLVVHQKKSFEGSRVDTLLEKLALPSTYLSTELSRLSTGEANLFRLIRALQLDPTVLLLDEPTSGLDPERSRKVELLLSEWSAEHPARASVIVSHDHALLARLTALNLEVKAGTIEEVKA